MHLIDKFSESGQLASMEINIYKGSDNTIPAIETENTLSNVTSIQSQLQSLYDCNDSSKNCYKYNNLKNINKISSNEKLLKMHASNLTESSNFNKSFDESNNSISVGGSNDNTKMKHDIQHHQKNQNSELEAKTKTMLSELKKNLSPQLATKKYAMEAKLKEEHPCDIVDQLTGPEKATPSGLNNAKTATILVSKTKTKTGLPLLLKNSIN